MPNVPPCCYSEPLLSAGLAYFWLHKTRGGDTPKKNLMAFPFEYKGYFTPDVSERLKIFHSVSQQETTRQDKDKAGVCFFLAFCAESVQ